MTPQEEIESLKLQVKTLQEQLVKQDERFERGGKLVESTTIKVERVITELDLRVAGVQKLVQWTRDSLVRDISQTTIDYCEFETDEEAATLVAAGALGRRMTMTARLGVWRVRK